MKPSMKNLLVSLACLLFCFSISAQNHQLFMGVELNATPELFVQNIENKGFKPIKGKTNVLEGKYEGLKCELTVFAASQSNVVNKVELLFPANLDGSELWSLMEKLLSAYGEKDRDGKYTNVAASEPGSIEIRTAQGGLKLKYVKFSEEEQKKFKAEGQYSLIYFDKVNMEKK